MQTKQEINAEGNGENTRRQINRITVSMEKALPKKTKKNLQQTHAAAGLSAAALFSAANNISGKPIRADAEKKIQFQQVNHKWMRGIGPTHKHCFRILFKPFNEDGQC